jgi:hypothetical protein
MIGITFVELLLAFFCCGWTTPFSRRYRGFIDALRCGRRDGAPALGRRGVLTGSYPLGLGLVITTAS